jgi:peptidoglycan/xylan/chitin deacetylase (PgdA/CDA1 family)
MFQHARPRLIWTTLAALAVCASAQPACAKPSPPIVAKADQHLWPDSVNTPALFDRASRATLLVYITTLASVQSMSDHDLQKTLQLEKIDRPSVDRWLTATWSASQRNYAFASQTCESDDWTCGAATSGPVEMRDTAAKLLANIPSQLVAWRTAMEQFSLAYFTEQLKLAAVFPRDNSEVDTLNANEWNGEHLPDRQFYLTFDDGPTAVNGNTDDTLKILSGAKKSATFFLQGRSLRTRLDKTGQTAVDALYGQQCVASDGWDRRSHARWDEWQDSVRLSRALVAGSFEKSNYLHLFRPPYGQRRPDSETFFEAQSLRVALWNIDSLDWTQELESTDVKNRVVALMLVKRHGVILFHDIDAKAKTVLPTLFQEIGSAVNWADCHDLGKL